MSCPIPCALLHGGPCLAHRGLRGEGLGQAPLAPTQCSYMLGLSGNLGCATLLPSCPYSHTPFSSTHLCTHTPVHTHTARSPPLHFLASLPFCHNTLNGLGSLVSTSIIFLSRAQQAALTGPSSLASRPHLSLSLHSASVDGPRILLPTTAVLWPSLEDTLRSRGGRSLGDLLILPLIYRERDQSLGSTLPKVPWT